MILSIIIPTYNEAGNIALLIKEIHKTLKEDYEIVVVDDNSPDGTGQIAKRLSKGYHVRVLIRKGERDLSSAVLDGFKIAKGNYLCVIDADLSHPPKLILDLYKALIEKKANIAIGSRLVKGGGAEIWPLYRRIISIIATFLARPLTKVKDPMSGFFIVRKEIIKNVKLKPKGYKILLEILVKTNCKNFIELPYIFRERRVGKTKLGFFVIINYIGHIGRLYLYMIKKLITNAK